ncbi:uncharacterized protein LOC123306015 [Chrysoperla carnea]|uniref:uncharacterized protein LOC123306015 n=1 Tax=Chrysoperla carnea TaxID=189513 RepID=UPI001D077F48|nr:uncharacterized protein LOC123306015 [Chrysoperla carnea]
MDPTKESCGYTKYIVVFSRSGRCLSTVEKKFPGWFDCPLVEQGRLEAASSGALLRKEGYQFDEVHTSVLTRVNEGADIILKELGQKHIPKYKTWRLNDLHYGDLTRKNKLELYAQYGEKQVQLWKQSYDVAPPPMTPDHPHYEEIINNPIFANGPPKDEFPKFESLKMLMERSIPYWENDIVPKLKQGKRILIVSSAQCFRGFIKYLDHISEERIERLKIPYGIPFVYELDKNFRPVVSMKFIATDAVVYEVQKRLSSRGYFESTLKLKTATLLKKVIKLHANYCVNLSKRCAFHSRNVKEGGSKVIFVRHGAGEWNDKNLFTGWYDVPLSDRGRREAIGAGQKLHSLGIHFDEAYTSVLTRAQLTLELILKEVGQENIPTFTTWRLNERHYGSLTGLNKQETAEKYGEQQVQIWRRSYDIAPPPMEPDHPYYKKIRDDPRYKDGPSTDEFPDSESLKDTSHRTIPYWRSYIIPKLRKGHTILVVAHQNSLRALVKYLDKLDPEQIMDLNLPTALPFVYEFDKHLQPIISFKFIEDEETVKQAMARVAAESKKKKKEE